MPDLASLASFPKKLAAMTAAIAAVSALVFPETLIPSNLVVLGPAGSVLIIITFLAAWAMHGDLLRHRRRLFMIASILCVAALGYLVVLNSDLVVYVDAMGDPPESHRFLVGRSLTQRGREWDRMAGSPSRAGLIKIIGEDRIEDAWGRSLTRAKTEYVIAYAVLAIGVVLMLSVALTDRNRRPGR